MLREFSLFGHTLSSYKVVMLLSITTGLSLLTINLVRERYSVGSILLIFSITAVSFFIGARLLNVLVNHNIYRLYPSLVFEFKIKGFSVIGGMVLSSICVLILLKAMKTNFRRFFDLASIPFLISFSLMKVGCFLNGCCGGKATTCFLGTSFPSSNTSNPAKVVEFIKDILMIKTNVYPTQLFESFFALAFIPFAILTFKSKTYYHGKVFFYTMAYFALFRLVVLFFRDLAYPWYIVYIIYPLFYVCIITFAIVAISKMQRKVYNSSPKTDIDSMPN